MKNRIVEITTDGAYIQASRGFVKISKDGAAIGQVAIDDIAALIIRGYGASLSVNICARMAAANIPVIICGQTQSPDAVIWPLSGHHAQGHIMTAQSALSLPRKKRLWQDLIKAKINTQGHILNLAGLNANDIFSLAKRVKSGDPDNFEAQAARRYWTRLFGEDFKRQNVHDDHPSPHNGALNYGYTVLRAATARSIVAAGLHPSLSLHHMSRGEALRLADDLMEPFRPWVDFMVFSHCDDIKKNGLTPDIKAVIVDVLSLDLKTKSGTAPLQLCLDRLAQSLAKFVMKHRNKLDLPYETLPVKTDLNREIKGVIRA